VKLSKPAIAYRYLLAEIAGKQLNVCGVYLQIGPLIHLLKKAREVAVGLLTVGSELEEAVRQLQASNDLLESYLLNCAAFEALDNVALYLKAMIEDKARRKKWGVSPALSPGALPGWPTADQHNLCSLLDLSQVGVKITDSTLLLPRYSLSLLVAMGPVCATTRVAATGG
jgi:cobalamin-dependent methionine synthase I